MDDQAKIGLCDFGKYLCGCIAEDYDDDDDDNEKGASKDKPSVIDASLMRRIDSRTFRELYTVHEEISRTARTSVGSPREDSDILRRVTHRADGISYTCKIVEAEDDAMPPHVMQEITSLQELQKLEDLSDSGHVTPRRGSCCSCFTRYDEEEEIEREYQQLGLGNADSICQLVDQCFNVNEGLVYMMLDYTTHSLRKYIDDRLMPTSESDHELDYHYHPMHDYHPMPEDQVRQIAWRLLDALEFIHKRKVVHQDVRPESIVFVANSQFSSCKLTNFGQSKVMGKKFFKQRRGRQRSLSFSAATSGSTGYVDPVAKHCNRPHLSTDLWSLGIVMYELFDGRVPFRPEHFCGDGYFPIDFAGPAWDPNRSSWRPSGTEDEASETEEETRVVSDSGTNFIECMLQLNPKDRWNAASAKSHAWFTGVPLDLTHFTRAETFDRKAVAKARSGFGSAHSSSSRSSWSSWSSSSRSYSRDFYSSIGSNAEEKSMGSGSRKSLFRREKDTLGRIKQKDTQQGRHQKIGKQAGRGNRQGGLTQSLIEEGDEDEGEG
jgi:serine/threonine protein kinase